MSIIKAHILIFCLSAPFLIYQDMNYYQHQAATNIVDRTLSMHSTMNDADLTLLIPSLSDIKATATHFGKEISEQLTHSGETVTNKYPLPIPIASQAPQQNPSPIATSHDSPTITGVVMPPSTHSSPSTNGEIEVFPPPSIAPTKAIHTPPLLSSRLVPPLPTIIGQSPQTTTDNPINDEMEHTTISPLLRDRDQFETTIAPIRDSLTQQKEDITNKRKLRSAIENIIDRHAPSSNNQKRKYRKSLVDTFMSISLDIEKERVLGNDPGILKKIQAKFQSNDYQEITTNIIDSRVSEIQAIIKVIKHAGNQE